MNRRSPYRTRDADTLPVQCWCRCTTLNVPRNIVRAGLTQSCGRRLCNDIQFREVLTAGAEPCDCDERKAG